MQLASFRACKLLFPASSEFFTHLCTCRYLFDFYTLFSCNPAVFLETSGFFQITTPRVLFLPSQQPPRKSPKLPARRAVVTAAGRARPRGFVLLSRRGVQNPSILTIFSNFPHLPQAAFPAAISSCSDVFCQRSRTAAQRPVFGLPAGTRSAVS